MRNKLDNSYTMNTSGHQLHLWMLIVISIPLAYRKSVRQIKEHSFALFIIISQQERCNSFCITNTRIVTAPHLI